MGRWSDRLAKEDSRARRGKGLWALVAGVLAWVALGGGLLLLLVQQRSGSNGGVGPGGLAVLPCALSLLAGFWALRALRSAGWKDDLAWIGLGMAGLALPASGGAALLASKLTRQRAPLTAQEVDGFARQLEQTLNQGQGDFYAGRLDPEELSRRAQKRIETGPVYQEALAYALADTDLAREELDRLAEHHARLRYLHPLPGTPVSVLFRELGPESLDYRQVFLARGQDGQVCWVDQRSLRDGVLSSQRLLRQAVRDMGPLGPQAETIAAYGQRLEELQDLQQAGRDHDVLEAFYKIPRAVREQPEALLIRLHAASRIGDPAYRSALEELQTKPGEGQQVELPLFEHLLARRQVPQAEEALERLQTAVGGDPHLEAVEGRLKLSQGRVGEAHQLAQRALNQEPDLVSALLVALDVALQQQDHETTADLLVRLAKSGMDLKEHVETRQDFASFRASKAYQTWQAAQ